MHAYIWLEFWRMKRWIQKAWLGRGVRSTRGLGLPKKMIFHLKWRVLANSERCFFKSGGQFGLASSQSSVHILGDSPPLSSVIYLPLPGKLALSFQIHRLTVKLRIELPASIGTNESDLRPVCGARRLSGARAPPGFHPKFHGVGLRVFLFDLGLYLHLFTFYSLSSLCTESCIILYAP